MADFPTLSIPPVYPLKEKWGDDDQTIRPKTEAGYVITSSKYSRNRKVFTVTYENLSAADKTALDSFLDTVNGLTDYFTWVHPASGISYTVRFDTIPEFNLTMYEGASYYYSTEFVFVEV